MNVVENVRPLKCATVRAVLFGTEVYYTVDIQHIDCTVQLCCTDKALVYTHSHTHTKKKCPVVETEPQY